MMAGASERLSALLWATLKEKELVTMMAGASECLSALLWATLKEKELVTKMAGASERLSAGWSPRLPERRPRHHRHSIQCPLLDPQLSS